MKEKRLNEIKGVLWIAASIIIFASLVSFTPFDLSFYTSHPNIPPRNLIWTFGAYLAGFVLLLPFGWSSYIIPLYFFVLGMRSFRQEKLNVRLTKIFGILLLMLSVGSLIAIVGFGNEPIGFSRSGLLGFMFSKFTLTSIGRFGSSVAFITLMILGLALLIEELISSFMMGIWSKVASTAAAFFKLVRFKKREVVAQSRPVAEEKREPRVAFK